MADADPTFTRFLPFLLVGIACTTLGATTHGLLRGLLQGAGIALILLSAWAMGASWRRGRAGDATTWLPSRDGDD